MMWTRDILSRARLSAVIRSATEPPRKVNWALSGLLRFSLACIVVCVHSAWFFGSGSLFEGVARLGGKAAVIGFLVISGFSIRASLDRAEEGFYTRRILRIYPAYVAAVLLTLGAQFATGGLVITPGQEFHGS